MCGLLIGTMFNTNAEKYILFGPIIREQQNYVYSAALNQQRLRSEHVAFRLTHSFRGFLFTLHIGLTDKPFSVVLFS